MGKKYFLAMFLTNLQKESHVIWNILVVIVAWLWYNFLLVIMSLNFRIDYDKLFLNFKLEKIGRLMKNKRIDLFFKSKKGKLPVMKTK